MEKGLRGVSSGERVCHWDISNFGHLTVRDFGQVMYLGIEFITCEMKMLIPTS